MKRLALCVLAAACGGSPPEAPLGARVGPALNAALVAFDQARAPVQCASPGPTLVDETLKGWRLSGTTMSSARSGAVSIGVIADAGGAAPGTLAVLGRLKAQLADVDLIVTLGGMGSTQAELEATLGVLADGAKGILVAIAGDLEPAPALAQAIGKLRARNLLVIDGRLARTIELPGATIGTLPGARSVQRLAAGADGCHYTAANVSALLGELTARAGIRIMATAEPPRGTTNHEASGELAITPGALHEIDVVLHGPMTEAPTPAKSGTRDGSATPLTPGTSDATTRLPARHTPTAGILTIDGTAWRWKPIADR